MRSSYIILKVFNIQYACHLSGVKLNQLSTFSTTQVDFTTPIICFKKVAFYQLIGIHPMGGWISKFPPKNLTLEHVRLGWIFKIGFRWKIVVNLFPMSMAPRTSLRSIEDAAESWWMRIFSISNLCLRNRNMISTKHSGNEPDQFFLGFPPCDFLGHVMEQENTLTGIIGFRSSFWWKNRLGNEQG